MVVGRLVDRRNGDAKLHGGAKESAIALRDSDVRDSSTARVVTLEEHKVAGPEIGPLNRYEQIRSGLLIGVARNNMAA